jgi:predicted nucleotidyltransferase
MDLTPGQACTIRHWAGAAQYVKEVRLFGSRARGRSKPDSDVDLAITIGDGTEDPDTIRGVYFAVGKNWQAELSALLCMRVHVGLYDSPDTKIVRQSCDVCSVLLFPLSDQGD